MDCELKGPHGSSEPRPSGAACVLLPTLGVLPYSLGKAFPHSPCALSLGLNEMLGAELLWSTCSPVSKRSDGFKPLT